MAHTKDLLGAVRYWNQCLQKYSGDECPPGGVDLWELDVKEMFPSLCRETVVEAVQYLHANIWGHMKSTTKARGKEMVFFINKLDRKLDRVGGGGDTEWFHRIPFSEVLKFVRFDTHCNDIFVVGGTVMRQVRGLAIGGTCSAPLANAYCVSTHMYSPLLRTAPQACTLSTSRATRYATWITFWV